MRNLLQDAKGYLAIITAFIACPCHLPITLPLLIGLAGGTALGTFLSQNALLIYAASTLYFLGALWVGWHWLDNTSGHTRKPGGIAQGRPTGRHKVVLLSSSTCSECSPTRELWRSLQKEHDFDFEEMDLLSRRGRELVSHSSIRKVPTSIIDGRVAFQGIPDREQAATAVREGV